MNVFCVVGVVSTLWVLRVYLVYWGYVVSKIGCVVNELGEVG